jgi:hypothetical protein
MNKRNHRKEGLHMWKKLITMSLIIAFIALFTLDSAHAGSKQRYMWYGAGIALGATALGLMAHQLSTYPHSPQTVYYPQPEPWYSPPPPPEFVPGHWEITREWVPGSWKRVWVPGYYDRWRNRVGGHYEDYQNPGHYVEKKVWIEGYYRNS